MQNKLIRTVSRTLLNTVILGGITAAAIFTIYTLKASGEKYIGGLAADINSIRKEASNINQAA